MRTYSQQIPGVLAERSFNERPGAVNLGRGELWPPAVY